MASITRAVPATLICHIRSTSRTPVRTGSITNARWTTACGRVSRIRLYNVRQDSSSPRSRRTKRKGKSVLGGARSTPLTERPPSWGSKRRPRFPEIPVTRTVGPEGFITAAVVSAEPDEAQAQAHLGRFYVVGRRVVHSWGWDVPLVSWAFQSTLRSG